MAAIYGEHILKYFTREEWSRIPVIEQLRLVNIYENYCKMIEFGLSPKKPDFMCKKERKNSVSLNEGTGKDNVKNENDSLENDEISFVGFPIGQINRLSEAKVILTKIINKLKKEIEELTNPPVPISPSTSGITDRYPKRTVSKKCYKEDEIPDDDDYIYCDDCSREWEGDCPIHGQLTAIPDKMLSTTSSTDSHTTLAMRTLPSELNIKPSHIESAGLGVWTREVIPKRVIFGPYLGISIPRGNKKGYCWQITRNKRKSRFVDAANPERSNWMRYVNCARHEEEQNLVAFQYKGQIYYRTVDKIEKDVELLVWYGDDYGVELGIDVQEYHKKSKACRKKAAKVCLDKKASEKKGINAQVAANACRESLPSSTSAKRCLERKRLHGTSKAAVEAAPCNKNIGTNDESITKESEQVSLSVEASWSDTVERSEGQQWIPPGERMYMVPGEGKRGAESSVSALRRVRIKRCEVSIFSFQGDVAKEGEERKEEEKGRGGGEGESKEEEKGRGGEGEEGGRRTGPEKGVGEGRERFECYHCGNVFMAKPNLIQHMKVHGFGNSYDCEVCGKVFQSNCILIRHGVTHTGSKPYKCEVCNKSFSQNISLIKHMRTHSGNKPYKCSECNKCFSRGDSLTTHMRTHSGNKPYKCSECNKSFSQNINLVTHMRIHSGNKPYKCSECNKSFNQSSNLVTHMRIHSGNKPYKCSECNKSFNQSSNLVTHMRIHSGNKPYKCSECNKSFSRGDSLTTHMRTHSGNKPYKCSECNKSFSQNIHLVTHMRIHTGLKPFKCGTCYKGFTTSSDLRRHSLVHTKEKPYECHKCRARFGLRGHLKTHIEKYCKGKRTESEE